MRKVEFEVTMNQQDCEDKKVLLESLAKDDGVQHFLSENHLPLSFLERHAYQINDFLLRQKKCINCYGLSMCQQEKMGYLLSLQFDRVLEKVLVPCIHQVEKYDKIKHKRQFVLCDMSDDQLALSFQHIQLENEKGSYIELVSKMIEACDHFNKQSFYLCGDPGTGKTYLACCFANEMAKQNKRIAFVNVPHYIASLKAKMFDKLGYAQQIDALRLADVAVFDDIAGEAVSNWSRDEILLPILNERMEHNRITLFTSNYDMQNLEKYYAVNSKIVNDTVGAKRLVERVKTLAKENVLNCMNRRSINSKN